MRPLPCSASSPLASAISRLRARPRLRDGAEALAGLGVLGVCAVLLAQGSPALHIDVSFAAARAEPGRMALIALIAVILPALGEELVFRGALQPLRLDAVRAAALSGLSLAAFIAWHPVQVRLGLPSGQAAFLDPAFLAMAGVLGLVCTVLVHRSGSLWTAVFVHWVVVVVWKAGEPFPVPPGAG